MTIVRRPMGIVILEGDGVLKQRRNEEQEWLILKTLEASGPWVRRKKRRSPQLLSAH